jgi:hypothetical protein
MVLRGETSLHQRFKADPPRIAEEVQARAFHLSDCIWLERLLLDLHAPAAASQPPSMSALDPVCLMAGLERDPDLLTRAGEILREVGGKLPGSIEADWLPLSEHLDALLADARALVLGRAETL